MRVQGGTGRQNSRPGELALLAALGFILAGCSSSGPQPSEHHSAGYHRGQPSYKVGSPYQINGKWYTPQVDYSYDETGLASWYGAAFDGQATANGEVFNLNELSAAHKTLPLPSVVEVTNLQNGRSLRLRVNDRGPYVDRRILDVSRRAAQLLGFEMAGTTPVRVRILKDESIQVAEAAKRGQSGSVQLAAVAAAPPPRPAPPPVMTAPPPQFAAAPPPEPPPAPMREPPPVREPPQIAMTVASPPQESAVPRPHWPSLISPAHAETLPPPAAAHPRAIVMAGSTSGRIFIQAGAFAMPENAQRVRARIAALGNVQVVPAQVNGSALYRVRVGPFANEAEADRLLSKVVGSGYPTARIISE
ncbi:MAG TPA: septal ring lytic transglycosylase RlpA family protein [Stellaceae bacterium]